MFVVTVEFSIAQTQVGPFLGAVREQAERSLGAEADCLRFDVCTTPEDPTRVFLYEMYTDADAFEAHLRSPHYAEFDAAVTPWVSAKQVRTWHLSG